MSWLISVDMRTIGRCDSPLIVDRSPPVAGIVNDGEVHGMDLDFTKYKNKVPWFWVEETMVDKCLVIIHQKWMLSGFLMDCIDTIYLPKQFLYFAVTNLRLRWYFCGGVGRRIFVFFSSPELKAQVSFSDHLCPSSVCPSVCLSVCPSVCKLFTFSSSSPESLGQFQSNLA